MPGNEPPSRKASPPWGHWEVLLQEPEYKVKRVVVFPGKRLSYQTHSKRSEHWTIVLGQGLATVNGRPIPLKPGQSLDIPCGAAHRISNPEDKDLTFIEVQRGSYLGEDDILRLEDDYGRSSG